MIVTIATGPLHRAMAEVTIPLMEAALGRKVTVIKTDSNPWLTKLRLVDEIDEPFLFVDCDMVFRRHWDPTETLRTAGTGTLCATIGVYARRSPKHIQGLDPERYLTTGLFAAGPAHRELFAQARELYAGEFAGHRWQEEPALNAAIQRTVARVKVLDERLNRMAVPGVSMRRDDIARHYPRLPAGDEERLEIIRREAQRAAALLQSASPPVQ